MTTVLMTTDTVGGVWTYSLDLAAALAERSVDVALAVVGPPPTAAQRDELDRAPLIASYIVGGQLEWMDDPWGDVAAAGQQLLEIATDVHPDVVHLNDYAQAVLPWAAPTVVVAHSDVLSWWRAVHGCAGPPAWAEYATRLRSSLHAATTVVAPTQAALAGLRAETGWRGGTVIPNGRRAEWVANSAKEPMIFSAGRAWDPAKNLAALHAVAPALDWPVVIAGSAPSALDSDGGGAALLGQLPFGELATWLGRAAIYAAPARYEPFGLAILEAAMSGCALVLGDIPSLHEVWGDVATYVHPDDHGALQAVLQSLIADPRRCVEAGERARSNATRYGIDHSADAYRSLYRSLLQCGSGVG